MLAASDFIGVPFFELDGLRYPSRTTDEMGGSSHDASSNAAFGMALLLSECVGAERPGDPAARAAADDARLADTFSAGA